MRLSSFQPIRLLERLLALEQAPAVEREQLEPGADLQPASVQPQRLEQHEQDQHDAVDEGLESRRVADHLGQPALELGNRLRHADQEGRAEEGAVHAAQSADHHHQQQVDALDDVELVRAQEADHVRIQRAADAGQRGADREAQRLVVREVDAHALGRDLAVADGDEGAPGGAAQQVQHRQRAQYRDDQAQEVELLAAVGDPAEHLRLADHLARVAAGHALPARQHLLDDEAEGQRRDAQVDALHAQRRQPDHGADGGRQRRGRRQRQRERPALRRQHRLRIGAHAQEGGVADREQPGEAGQHHQPEADDAVDQDEGQLRQAVALQPPGCGDQRQHQQRIPDPVATVLGQHDVLVVARLEDESHAGYTFLRRFSPNRPLGLTISMISTTT